jgi:hypothetical protein
MTHAQPPLRSQRLRLVNHQGDALRLGMNWTEEDLGKPQAAAALTRQRGPTGRTGLGLGGPRYLHDIPEVTVRDDRVQEVAIILLPVNRCDR